MKKLEKTLNQELEQVSGGSKLKDNYEYDFWSVLCEENEHPFCTQRDKDDADDLAERFNKIEFECEKCGCRKWFSRRTP